MDTALFLDQLKKTPYISKQNLGLLLGKTEDNLDYWVKKLTLEKVLIPLKKGFYISRYYYDILDAANVGEKERYLIFLANSIRQPSYVSLEYVLTKNGLLPESSFSVTSITLKSTRKYDTCIGTFYYKNIKRELFYGYAIQQFRDKQIREAGLAKALFDFLYLRSFESSTEIKNYLISTGRFNWDVFGQVERKEFDDVVRISQSKKMQALLDIMKKEKII